MWVTDINGACNVKLFLAPPPGALGRGQKVKDFYIKLCVCSHKWKIQIRQNFHSDPWVMPKGWDFWSAGGAKGVIFFQAWSCGISNWRGWQAEQNASKILILGLNWWPWGEVKGQISLKFGYHANFKDFYTTFCVCSHKSKIQNISDGIFILSPGWCPRGWAFGHWGYPGGQTIFFQTWSCSIPNRRGWRADQNASNIFILGSNWWPWGEVKRSNIIYMSISKIFIPNFVCVLTN